MTGENGIPETPDWSLPESLARGIQQAHDGLARRCDWLLADEPKTLTIPPNIELGEN